MGGNLDTHDRLDALKDNVERRQEQRMTKLEDRVSGVEKDVSKLAGQCTAHMNYQSQTTNAIFSQIREVRTATDTQAVMMQTLAKTHEAGVSEQKKAMKNLQSQIGTVAGFVAIFSWFAKNPKRAIATLIVGLTVVANIFPGNRSAILDLIEHLRGAPHIEAKENPGEASAQP